MDIEMDVAYAQSGFTLDVHAPDGRFKSRWSIRVPPGIRRLRMNHGGAGLRFYDAISGRDLTSETTLRRVLLANDPRTS